MEVWKVILAMAGVVLMEVVCYFCYRAACCCGQATKSCNKIMKTLLPCFGKCANLGGDLADEGREMVSDHHVQRH
jgi:hypothetical protein